jgi:hypothetical protein
MTRGPGRGEGEGETGGEDTRREGAQRRDNTARSAATEINGDPDPTGEKNSRLRRFAAEEGERLRALELHETMNKNSNYKEIQRVALQCLYQGTNKPRKSLTVPENLLFGRYSSGRRRDTIYTDSNINIKTSLYSFILLILQQSFCFA